MSLDTHGPALLAPLGAARPGRRRPSRRRRARLRGRGPGANTLKAYRSDWAKWCSWCAREALDPLAGEAAAISKYLVFLAGAGAKVGTMARPVGAHETVLRVEVVGVESHQVESERRLAVPPLSNDPQAARRKHEVGPVDQEARELLICLHLPPVVGSTSLMVSSSGNAARA